MCREALYSRFGINCTKHPVDLFVMSFRCSGVAKVVYSSFVVGEYHGGTAMGGKFISYCRPASFVTVLYERQFNLREKMIGKNRDKEMRCRFFFPAGDRWASVRGRS